jgi:endonuclease III
MDAQQRVIDAVMGFYTNLAALEENAFMRWSQVEKKFSTIGEASEFFIGCLLSQGQCAERAWDSATYFVQNHFSRETIWSDIAASSVEGLQQICVTGYGGRAFAGRYMTNKLAPWLKMNGEIMVERYAGDPRNIWKELGPRELNVLYDRLLEFAGIGDALAKMTQFLLVREYGVAGGVASKRYLSVKPDVHVQRVCYRLGLVENISACAVAQWAGNAGLESPADFDAAIWEVGHSYCHEKNAKCDACPLLSVCIQKV